MEYDLLIREAEISDASEVIALLDQIGQESSFTSLDENGLSISESEMQIFIDKQAQSENQITLLAFLNDELAGIINITADQRPRVRHIGDIFLGIKKAFWGFGLGSILMEEAIEWAKTSKKNNWHVFRFGSSNHARSGYICLHNLPAKYTDFSKNL